MDKQEKILIIGSGGREHTVGWKLSHSPRNPVLYFVPGNAGTASIGTNVDIKATDIPALISFAKKEGISLTLALPDDPLALGIVDEFQKEGLAIWGPTKACALLESSKAFAKEVMERAGIPTATYKTFENFDEAVEFSKNEKYPLVVKASGLALGKGVSICANFEEAQKALEDILVKKVFGEMPVVIEEFLEGREVSFHAFCDGENYSLFPVSKDHKRVGEGNVGPNTGGMGTIAPVPGISETDISAVENQIVKPLLLEMKKRGTPFVGVIYPGVMLTSTGPKVIEFNARFGDPETESYMRILETDLLEIFEVSLRGELKNIEIEWKNESVCSIALCSAGYPSVYEKGKIITGINEAEKIYGVVVFHGGTKTENGELVTNGGRVLHVTSTDPTLPDALQKAYEAISKINFEGMYFRRDIGK